MSGTQVDVLVSPDGSLVIRPPGVIGLDQAVVLQQTLVHALRHTRPLRLIVDLRHVADIDPINIGTVAAACGLGDDHQVVVFVENPSAVHAARLTAAGVPTQRIRHTAPATEDPSFPVSVGVSAASAP